MIAPNLGAYFYKEILRFIEDNYGDTELSLMVELYTHWYDALKNVQQK